MPPITQPPMPEEDRDILLSWLDDDLPLRRAEDSCAPTPIRDLANGVGPNFLECEVTHRFVAGYESVGHLTFEKIGTNSIGKVSNRRWGAGVLGTA